MSKAKQFLDSLVFKLLGTEVTCGMTATFPRSSRKWLKQSFHVVKWETSAGEDQEAYFISVQKLSKIPFPLLKSFLSVIF